MSSNQCSNFGDCCSKQRSEHHIPLVLQRMKQHYFSYRIKYANTRLCYMVLCALCRGNPDSYLIVEAEAKNRDGSIEPQSFYACEYCEEHLVKLNF